MNRIHRTTDELIRVKKQMLCFDTYTVQNSSLHKRESQFGVFLLFYLGKVLLTKGQLQNTETSATITCFFLE